MQIENDDAVNDIITNIGATNFLNGITDESVATNGLLSALKTTSCFNRFI